MIYNSIEHFIRHSDHVAIYFKDQKITYSNLYDNVSRYSNKLLETHSAGDEILITLSDCPEYFYLFWGAVKAGVVPMLLNNLLSENEKNKIIEEYKPKTIFNDTNIKDFDFSAVDTTDNTIFNTTPNALCFYMFSSGTTGYIKRIPHRHKDMIHTCINYAKNTLFINAYDVCFSSAKLSFAYGFGNSMTFPLYVGASSVLMDEPATAKNTLDIIEKYKPTIYFGVPTLYAKQLKLLENKSRNLSSLKIAVSAGEFLPGPIYEGWMEKTGITILDGIGSTEALHIFISNRYNDHEANCTGKIVSGYKARIVDIDLNELPEGEIGQLQIKGNSLYDEDWISTGDMFCKVNGKFYYKGRYNDMIKIGGVWVSPTIIESKILEHSNVLEAGVINKANNIGLPKIHAFVVLKDQTKNMISIKHQIKKLCLESLPDNHYPHYVHVVDELPKTVTGKIQRFKLKMLELSDELSI